MCTRSLGSEGCSSTLVGLEPGLSAGVAAPLAQVPKDGVDGVVVEGERQNTHFSTAFEHRILGLDPGSEEQVLGVLTVRFSPPVPTALVLHQNSPNPFNPVTRIRVAVPKHLSVEVRIIDASGRFVAELWNGPIQAGHHTLTWEGKDSHGRAATSGIYFCRTTADSFQQTRKLVLLQ